MPSSNEHIQGFLGSPRGPGLVRCWEGSQAGSRWACWAGLPVGVTDEAGLPPGWPLTLPPALGASWSKCIPRRKPCRPGPGGNAESGLRTNGVPRGRASQASLILGRAPQDLELWGPCPLPRSFPLSHSSPFSSQLKCLPLREGPDPSRPGHRPRSAPSGGLCFPSTHHGND